MRSLKSRLLRALHLSKAGWWEWVQGRLRGGGRPLHGTSRFDDASHHFADKQLWNQAQQGRLADALALRGDEGRGRLR